MYRKILLPTDGSALCDSAAQKGIEFAKFAGASVVGFHAIPATSYLIYTEAGPSDILAEQFEREAKVRGERLVETLERAGQPGGRRLRNAAADERSSLGRHHRGGHHDGMRPDIHGIARSPRTLGNVAGKRNGPGTDPHQDSGDGLPIARVGQRGLAQGYAARKPWMIR